MKVAATNSEVEVKPSLSIFGFVPLEIVRVATTHNNIQFVATASSPRHFTIPWL